MREKQRLYSGPKAGVDGVQSYGILLGGGLNQSQHGCFRKQGFCFMLEG